MQAISQTKESQIPDTPLRFVWYIVRPFKWSTLAILLFVTTASIIGNLTPYLFKLIIDSAIAEDVEKFILWTILYPIMIGTAFLCWRASGLIGGYMLPNAEVFGYKKLFAHLIQHSDSFFSEQFAGSISSKISRATGRAETILDNTYWNYYTGVLQLIMICVLTSLTSIWIGLAFLGAVVFLLALNYVLVKRRRPHVVDFAAASSALSGATVDAIANVRAVHQFARTEYEQERIEEKIEIYKKKNSKTWYLSETGMIINNIIIVIMVSCIVFILGKLWVADAITTGDVVMVLTLLAGMMGTLTFIGQMMNSFIRHYGEIEEGLMEILKPHDLLDAPGATDLKITNASIAIEELSFAYNDADVTATVLHELNLTIPPQQKIGLVGQSGAGKTTLVSLLLRQHNIATGSIAIDGQNIAKVTQDSLRRAIAFVPQDPALFHRSLYENIAYGKPDATKEEIERAAQMAQAHDFILESPEGYDTLVGERGIKLSGGQRQRIAIARAILKDAPILILDEATSALDSESEVLIQKALHELMKGKTVIAIAHRLSTLREMDRIIVMDQGRIVGDGTHDELTQQDGVYKRLWEHQAGGFLQE